MTLVEAPAPQVHCMMAAVECALRENDPEKLVEALLSTELNVKLENSSLLIEKLRSVKELLSKSISVLNNRISSVQKTVSSDAASSGDTILTIPEAQMLEPRGKFSINITTSGIHAEGKSVSFFAKFSNISHLALVPSGTSTKTDGEDVLILKFSSPVKVNNKEHSSLAWTLSKSEKKKFVLEHSRMESTEGTESHVVCYAIQKLCPHKKLVMPKRELFLTIASQKPYLRCYSGKDEGLLYPLENGMLFVKPVVFIPTESIASLSAGRGGGSGNTRYVDIKVETVQDKIIEFTNIEREELAAIQIYVKGYLESKDRLKQLKKEDKDSMISNPVKQQQDSSLANATDSNNTNNNNDNNDDDDDDDDDEDYDPDAKEDSNDENSDDSDDQSTASEDNSALDNIAGQKKMREDEHDCSGNFSIAKKKSKK